MRLLIDSDIFCKLAIGGLLFDSVSLLGVEPEQCGRLPALPHMLRRGRLPKLYGVETCNRLTEIANGMPLIPVPDSVWLDRLAGRTDIDPGEVQIFAAAAQFSLTVMTGDKRSLRALKSVDGFPDALSGRIVVLEALLLGLCDQLGTAEVTRRLAPLLDKDLALGICFSPRNPNPTSALESYFRSLAEEVQPLVLWQPQPRGVS